MATFDEKVVRRVGELVFRASAWHRRLWGIGTIGAIAELADAGDLVLATGYGTQRFVALCRQVGELVKRDPALPNDVRAVLLREIYKNSPPDGQRLANLRQLSSDFGEVRYVELLAAVAPADRSGVELWARSIAAHLLDVGWSEDAVRQLSDRHLAAAPIDLQAFLDDAASRREQSFEVVVAGARIPMELQVGGGWVPRDQPPVDLPTVDLDGLSGFFTASITAWDKASAGAAFGAQLLRAASRYQASRRGRKPLVLAPKAYVRRGAAEPWRQFDLSPAARRVEVKEVTRDGPESCFEPSWSDSVDNALILAETAEAATGPQVPALLWASLESIFDESDDLEFHLSQRLSWLLLASLVRAELTVLAHHLVKDGGPISARLRTATSNGEKCRLLEEAIRDGQAISFNDVRDELAYERLRELFVDPQTAARMRSYLAGAISRVQRERNRGMHGGTLSLAGGRVAERSGPPLVAAVLDRVVWAEKQEPPVPLDQLLARAMVRGQLVFIDQSDLPASQVLEADLLT